MDAAAKKAGTVGAQWTFVTDEKGEIRYNKNYLDSEADNDPILSYEYEVEGKTYTRNVFPVGSIITIAEIQPPENFREDSAYVLVNSDTGLPVGDGSDAANTEYKEKAMGKTLATLYVLEDENGLSHIYSKNEANSAYLVSDGRTVTSNVYDYETLNLTIADKPAKADARISISKTFKGNNALAEEFSFSLYQTGKNFSIDGLTPIQTVTGVAVEVGESYVRANYNDSHHHTTKKHIHPDTG